MASWGAKLYQDDIAEDIRDGFKDQLRRGKTVTEITDLFIQEFADELEDRDDAPVFWFAMADTQWELGMLQPMVKENALYWLKEGTDLQRWEEEDPKAAKVRKKVLEDLHQKLLSPMPPEKKLPQYKIYKCEWKMGDVFAYKLESDLAKEKGLDGNYLLLQKVDEDIWWPGHIIPIVRIKMYIGDTIPTSEKEIEEAPYVQMGCMKATKLVPYFVSIINSSKKIIPKKLEYIGNYPNIRPPKNEYIPEEKINNSTCSWKEIEDKMINKYLRFLQHE